LWKKGAGCRESVVSFPAGPNGKSDLPYINSGQFALVMGRSKVKETEKMTVRFFKFQ